MSSNSGCPRRAAEGGFLGSGTFSAAVGRPSKGLHTIKLVRLTKVLRSPCYCMAFNSTNTDILFAGAFAAFTVDLLVYPLDTIKTRLQSPDYKRLYTNASTNTANHALFRGLYQGIGSVVIATVPSCMSLASPTISFTATTQSRLYRSSSEIS